MNRKASFQASVFEEFRAAAQAALAYLHDRLDFESWIVFRLDGGELVAEAATGPGGEPPDDDVVGRAGALCAAGAGPVVEGEPTLGACLVVPIAGAGGGSPGGWLWGGARHASAGELERHVAVVELVARLLAAVLAGEARALEAADRAERAEEEARTDSLTGVASRRSWTRIMEREEARSRRYGHPASVVSIDLDDLKQVNDSIGHAAGDELLRRSAEAIKSATRENDVVARLGGDEFGVLAFESDEQAAGALSERIVAALAASGIEASVGVATRDSEGSLDDTWRQADEAMYQEKRARAQAA